MHVGSHKDVKSGGANKTDTLLTAKPELELSLLLLLYFHWHQIHAGSLGGGSWPEINAAAIFCYLFLYLRGNQKVPSQVSH